MRQATRCRPFTILDGMILTAALAVGFGLSRLCWPRSIASPAFSPHAIREWSSATCGAIMLPWTLSFIAIRLLRPRPTIDRLMCQPGMAACCAGAVAIAAGLCPDLLPLLYAPHLAPGRSVGKVLFLRSYWYIYKLPVGPAVVATWLALVLGGYWRPERGWIDALGRCIGASWIIFALAQWEFGRWTAGLVYSLSLWVR